MDKWKRYLFKALREDQCQTGFLQNCRWPYWTIPERNIYPDNLSPKIVSLAFQPGKECLQRQPVSRDNLSCLKQIISGESQLQTCVCIALPHGCNSCSSLKPLTPPLKGAQPASFQTSQLPSGKRLPLTVWQPDSCLFAFFHLSTLPGSALE